MAGQTEKIPSVHSKYLHGTEYFIEKLIVSQLVKKFRVFYGS